MAVLTPSASRSPGHLRHELDLDRGVGDRVEEAVAHVDLRSRAGHQPARPVGRFAWAGVRVAGVGGQDSAADTCGKLKRG